MNQESRIKNQGFSLIEMLFYIAIVTVLGGVVIILIFALINGFSKVLTKKEILNNARTSMDRMLNEIKYAVSVYAPTSDFVGNPGHLSLESAISIPQNDKRTYVDFYIVSGRLFLKREGKSAEVLTTEKINITSLKFDHYNATASSEAVGITLTFEQNPANPAPELQNKITLQSTAALRGK